MNNNDKRITDLSKSYVPKFSLMTIADFWLASLAINSCRKTPTRTFFKSLKVQEEKTVH